MIDHYYILSTKYTIQERQTKRNGKVYDVVFRVITEAGEVKQKHLSGYKTKSFAKNAYTEFVTNHCSLVKGNPFKKKDTKKETVLLGDLFPQYLNAMLGQCKESTMYDRKVTFESYILPKLSTVKMDDLTSQELYRWQDELWQTKNPKTGEAYSYAYLIKIRNYFCSFLSWCESRYGFKNNLLNVTKPKRRSPKKEMQIWTRDEFEQFINSVDDQMYHCLFTLMFFTGRRKGEIFALTPGDIHQTSIYFGKSVSRKSFDNDLYKITSTKAEKVLETPVCKRVQEELKNYKAILLSSLEERLLCRQPPSRDIFNCIARKQASR